MSLNLNYLNSFYKKQGLHFSNELEYIEVLKTHKDWLSKADTEKQRYRKERLKMYKVHFSDAEDIEYMEQSVLVTDCILGFLEKTSYYATIKFEELITKEEQSFFRIYNILWCEKELLFYGTSLRATKIHIPFDLLEPLIEVVKSTHKYQEFKLEELLMVYKKMLDLFPIH